MFVATGYMGGKVADLVFQQQETTQTSGGATTWTFNNVSIGDEAADRYVIACVGLSVTALSGRTLSAVSLGGTNGTIHANANNDLGGISTRIAAIAGRLIPTGSTITVVVTNNLNMSQCTLRIYTMTRYRSSTPSAVATETANNAAAVSDTINIPSAGALIVTSLAGTSTGTCTMAGVDEDPSTENTGNIISCSGHQDGLGAETGRTISVTETGAAGTPEWAMAAAVWQ